VERTANGPTVSEWGGNAVCHHWKDTARVFFLVLMLYEGNTGLSKASFFVQAKIHLGSHHGGKNCAYNSRKDQQALSGEKKKKRN